MVHPDRPEGSEAASEAEDFSPLAELGVAPERRSLVRRLLHFVGYVALAAYFGFAATVLALRFWLLPQIEAHPDFVAQTISRNIGQRVSIGSIDSGWQGLRPFLAMTDVRLYDADAHVVLSLPSVSCTLGWDSLAYGALRFHSLALDRPNLKIRRDASGALYVAGVRLNTETAGAGFSEWLLAQREVIIRDAQLTWDDELRRAPELALANLNFVMRNRGAHHRFALRAQPPRQLAAALDLRGDLVGSTFQQLQAWNGKLYAELPYTNLAAWRAWVDYPLEIQHGQGGLRLWLGFADRRVEEATADVALADIGARLAPDLPLLEMRSLQGRLSAKRARGGYEIGGREVALELQSGVTLPPARFAVQWQPGGAAGAEQGEVRIDSLELQPLARLGEFLPLPPQLRKFLADAAPVGRVADMHFDWQGPLQEPQRYSARGRFERLGMRAYARFPGFSGISGNIDASEKGGSAVLNASKGMLELPHVFPEPARDFDSLSAQLAWTQVRGELQLKLSNVAFANADVAGTAFGSYATQAGGPGYIDLTARLNRGDARQAARYVPFASKDELDWLEHGLLAGHVNELSLRLRGELKDFPFRGKKGGQFDLAAKVTGASLRPAPGWPTIDGIDAEVHLDGDKLEVQSRKAHVLAARVINAHVVLIDPLERNSVLTVNGQAEGPTAEFLKFVARSPVNRLTDGISANMSASGNGKLQLKLELPLAHLDDAKVSGSYQLLANQVRIDPEWPPLGQVSGRLDFTETGVSLRTSSAQFLGGPASVSLASQRDGSVAVNAQGRINAAALQAALELPLLRQVSGSTPWRASMNFRKRGASILVESSLQGIVSTLPAPLAKSGADTLPLRFEHTVSTQEAAGAWSGPPAADRTTLDLGTIVRIELQRRREDGKMAIVRGAIGLNEPPRLPEKGVVLNGTAPALDLDAWLHALGGPGAAPIPLTALALKVGALDVYGKRINDVSLRAGFRDSDWLAHIDARELAGDVHWRAQGKGRVSAQLSHFTFPEPTPGKRPEQAPPKELPGLDIVADSFVVHGKKLGKLELTAANAGLDWRIESLTLTTPESRLSADGLWQGVAAQQRTVMNLKLQIGDIGKYLERYGYPGSMQRGTATLMGKLSWAGGPQSIDFPSLSGDLSLIAEKGQFLKLEPGIGKLLGILSLQALPRRITLDFRDIFSEGFAFDTITGTAAVQKGVLHTKDFVMHGPSAQVAMSGSIDLAQETQALTVRVVPSVGDSLSVAGLMLAHPIAGVASFVAQRLFKDPLGRALAYEYSVTGSWADPKVEKITHERSTHADEAPDAAAPR